MNKKEKESLINDITALINITDNIAGSFMFKALELKEMYKEEITRYKNLKGMIEGTPLDTDFEIKNEKGSWKASIPGCPNFDTRLLPNEILIYIINNCSNPGIIGMLKDFQIKDGRKFDLTFQMKSEGIISATIKEKIEKNNEEIDSRSSCTAEKPSKMPEFEELFIYLRDNEGFYNWLMGQFYSNWKPLIDNGCFQKII